MEQENNMSAGVPVGVASPMPPAPKRGSHLLIIAIVIILLLLAGGGYYLWSSGLLQNLMPSATEQVTPVPNETSDIEADLQGVDVSSDAEVDSLEAQI